MWTTKLYSVSFSMIISDREIVLLVNVFLYFERKLANTNSWCICQALLDSVPPLRELADPWQKIISCCGLWLAQWLSPVSPSCLPYWPFSTFVNLSSNADAHSPTSPDRWVHTFQRQLKLFRVLIWEYLFFFKNNASDQHCLVGFMKTFKFSLCYIHYVVLYNSLLS